jgi:hypothetical protein
VGSASATTTDVGMFAVAGYQSSVDPPVESSVYARWRWMVAISSALTWLVEAWPERLASVSERVSVKVLPAWATPVMTVPFAPRLGYGS